MSNFVYDEPVGEKQCFVGRQKQLRTILDQLLHSRNVVLCGGPKTGRTSVLQKLMLMMKALPQNTEGQRKIIPVYINLREIFDSRLNIVFEKLWNIMQEEFRAEGLIVEAQGQGPRVKFSHGVEAFDEFEKHLQAVREAQQGTKTWSSYALFFDEADFLIEQNAIELLTRLARLSDFKESWGPESIICTGGRRIRDYSLEPASPLKNFRPHFLGALKVDEFAAILKPLNRFLSEPQLDAIEAASGRHPYVTQRICAEIAQLEGNDTLDKALDNAADDLQNLFTCLWEEFDLDRGVTYKGVYAAPEHALMQLMQENITGVELVWAEEELSISPLKEYMEFLEFAGLVDRGLSGNTYLYSAKFDLWNYWYMQRLTI